MSIKYLQLVKNTDNDGKGYNQINCNRIQYFRHRIIAYAYLGLDIDNPKLMIDHINHDKLNNCVDNLRLVSNQQNQFNKNAKGYCLHKSSQKYQASIKLNGKNILQMNGYLRIIQ